MKYDPDHPWAVRKAGIGGVCSNIPYCGYTPQTIKNMQSAGYILTFQGKRIKPENKKE